MAKATPTATKPMYQSTTLQGVVLSLIPTILVLAKHFGLEVDGDSLTQLMLGLVGVVGAAVTIYGRLRNHPADVKKLTLFK